MVPNFKTVEHVYSIFCTQLQPPEAFKRKRSTS